jgi:deoxycytidylate deaminase
MKIASTSTANNKHGCVIVKGGSVQSVGVNSNRNHPTIVSHPKTDSSVHAEVAALKALDFDAEDCIAYIARVNNRDDAMMSKPCDRCMNELIAAGIKRVVWTISGELDINEQRRMNAKRRL